MAHQALDHGEILNVRWATVDPNPAAQKREARKVEDQAAEAVRRALPASFVAELEGRDPEAAKRRKIEGSFGLQGYDAPDDVWYARETAALEQQANVEERMETGARQIEAPPDDVQHVGGGRERDATGRNGGILSSNTLEALKGVVVNRTTAKPKNEAPQPLVGYGSDDESD